jgi:hypothetical protein
MIVSNRPVAGSRVRTVELLSNVSPSLVVTKM